MKIISWNVNGIRACIKKGFMDFLRHESPDVLAIQETKLGKDTFDTTNFNQLGYQTYFFSAKKLGYSGVGIFVKKDIEHDISSGLGISELDDEARTIELNLKDFSLINAYFPNSQEGGKRLDYKLFFCDSIKSYLDKLSKKGKGLVICGDYNIAHTEIDLTNPKSNEKSPGFLPEERTWMSKFLKNDYVDTFRMFTKDPGHYTWWSYRTNARSRNVGWRIDYHCTNKLMEKRVLKSYHNTNVLGSDHCPVTVLID